MMNAPAHLLARQGRGLTAAIAQGIGGGQMPAHISIKANRFTLVDAAGNRKPWEQLSIHVVIVDANPNVSKIYYADAFDPTADEYKPPTCFSDNGKGPSSSATQPQHHDCATCPHNVWGSKVSNISGKSTKACGDAKKIAVFVPELGQDVAFQIRIPPATLKNLAQYVKSLSGNSLGDRPVQADDVITKVSFDPDTQGVLNFAAVSFIDEQTLGWIEKAEQDDRTAKIVGRDDVPYTGGVEKLERPAQAEVQRIAVAAVQQAVEKPAPFLEQAVEEPKGRGRPKGTSKKDPDTTADLQRQIEEMKAKLAAANKQADETEIPTFLKKRAAVQQEPAALQQEPAAKQHSSFGLVSDAPQPNAALKDALAAAFSLKTGG